MEATKNGVRVIEVETVADTEVVAIKDLMAYEIMIRADFLICLDGRCRPFGVAALDEVSTSGPSADAVTACSPGAVEIESLSASNSSRVRFEEGPLRRLERVTAAGVVELDRCSGSSRVGRRVAAGIVPGFSGEIAKAEPFGKPA